MNEALLQHDDEWIVVFDEHKPQQYIAASTTESTNSSENAQEELANAILSSTHHIMPICVNDVCYTPIETLEEQNSQEQEKELHEHIHEVAYEVAQEDMHSISYSIPKLSTLPKALRNIRNIPLSWKSIRIALVTIVFIQVVVSVFYFSIHLCRHGT
jgi:phenylpyruvate tautomerase PptA (4-oxalocrotonate tautomerase family)